MSLLVQVAVRPVQQIFGGSASHWIHRSRMKYEKLMHFMPKVQFLPHDAMHPRYSPWPCVRPSVCPSVCSSVTSRCSTKTAKRRITQTTPHDSPGTLVFGCQRPPQNSTGVTPYEGAECRCSCSCSLAVLDPRVGHTMDLLSLFIPVLCHSD